MAETFLVAKCREGCVTWWSMTIVPRAEVTKWLGAAHDLGYKVEQVAELPASVNLECEHR